MRAFVRLRHILAANAGFAHKLDALVAKFIKHQDDNAKRHAEHENHSWLVFEALRRLLDDSGQEPPPRLGFDVKWHSAIRTAYCGDSARESTLRSHIGTSMRLGGKDP